MTVQLDEIEKEINNILKIDKSKNWTEFEKALEFDENYKGEVAKIELLKELMPDILGNNHRMLIFSQFLGTLEEIKIELDGEISLVEIYI